MCCFCVLAKVKNDGLTTVPYLKLVELFWRGIVTIVCDNADLAVPGRECCVSMRP